VPRLSWNQTWCELWFTCVASRSCGGRRRNQSRRGAAISCSAGFAPWGHDPGHALILSLQGEVSRTGGLGSSDGLGSSNRPVPPLRHGQLHQHSARERRRWPGIEVPSERALRFVLAASLPRTSAAYLGRESESVPDRASTSGRPQGLPPYGRPPSGLRRRYEDPVTYVVVAKIPLTQLIAPGFDGVPVSSGTTVKELNLIAGLS
jgi:hypothetical protein